MIEYKYFDLFQHSKGSVDKDWKIEYDGGSFTDWDMESESIELTESLCSETELRFGNCEASCLKFTVANIVKPLINEWIALSVTIDHHNDDPLVIGRYKVASEELTADRQYKKIVAYDAMYDIINADMAAWYNSVLPEENSAITMKQFRESFVRYFGLTEVLPKGGLVNDDMTVQRTIQPEQISGKDVITAICEINGCFGHIGRDGKFHYIYLPQAIEGLYPANDLYPDHAPEWMAQAKTGHLYPQDPKTTRIRKGSYIPPCNYESYRTKPITKIQIRQEENDIGKIWPETPLSDKDNCYIIQDNFLAYGKSSDELSVIAQNILGKITDIIYRPFDCTAVGNPCMEVGDPVRLNTKYEIVESYILQRTLKGIQALRDTYKSNGVEKYAEDVDSVHRSIIQLKGKTYTMTSTIEGMKLEIKDMEQGLNATISATASQIRTEVSNVRENLQSQITQNAGEIDLRVKKDGVVAAINLTPETVTIQASKIDLKGLVSADELVSKFATISTLNATTANLNNVIATKATIDNLNAVDAKVNRIDADYASVSSLNAAEARLDSVIATKATIDNLNAVDAKFQNLNASNIKSGTLSAARIDAASLSIGASQIQGSVIIVYASSSQKQQISYVTPNGNTATVEVVTSLNFSSARVLGVV